MFVGCLTSQQQASACQGRICSDDFTCCHTETEVADPTFHLTQSQYTDTEPTSPSTDPITPSAWQGSHRSANFEVTGMTRPRKIPAQAGFEPGIFRSDSTWKNDSRRKRDSNPGLLLSRRTPLPLGQRGGLAVEEDPSLLDLGDSRSRLRSDSSQFRYHIYHRSTPLDPRDLR